MSQPCAIDDERAGLLGELTAGFEALMQKADELTKTNSHLLDYIKTLQEDQRRLTPNKSISNSSTFPDLGSLPSPSEAQSAWRRDPVVDKGIQAWKLLKIATMPAVPLRGAAPHQDQGHNQVKDDPGEKEPAEARASDVEKDFTTSGPKGDLRCPFSRTTTLRAPINSNSRETIPVQSSNQPSSPVDPIAAEFHESQEHEASSVSASAAKCPIRYMDQHSPEEIAQYFQNHRHEVPRSHEVCVRRYQSNEASIRALDAKYGSLVKMLEDLGQIHKPMLPEKEAGEAEAANGTQAADAGSLAKVERWAQDCAQDAEPPAEENDNENENKIDDVGSEARTGHFERPLKEVRLGESPSRPWGIQVPYSVQAAASSEGAAPANKSSGPGSFAAPPDVSVHEPAPPTPPAKCPMHDVLQQQSPPREAASERPAGKAEAPHPMLQVLKGAMDHGPRDAKYPQVVFNGPVFFGYPADSAAKLINSLREDLARDDGA